MSSLPPPLAFLEPLAKSAPVVSAAMNRGISLPSVDPSASIITMMSPEIVATERCVDQPPGKPVGPTILR